VSCRWVGRTQRRRKGNGCNVTDDTDTAELARLQDVIADNDVRDGAIARWRAANAVYDKADIVERLDGADAALTLYADVVQRLEGSREAGPRELLICAMNVVAVTHHQQGRSADSRSAAEALVSDHFDDAPTEATEALANGTLLLAELRSEAGEHEQALELLERLIERYGGPGAPDHRRTAAVANTRAASILGQLGSSEQGVRRFKSVIAELGDPVEPALRLALLDALIQHANLLIDMDLPLDRNAVCTEIVERFSGCDDPEIVKHVAWAQMLLDSSQADSWFALGYKLHHRIGRADEAETAYRRAIEGGLTDAWLNVGILLSAVGRRRADEESALRLACESEDPEVAGWAALLLGYGLNHVHGDVDGARAYFEVAAERGAGAVALHARINLAFLAAHEGDRSAARERLSAAVVAMGDARGCDMRGCSKSVTAAFAAVASGRLTREPWRRFRSALYRASRGIRTLKTSSPPARWLGQIAERARPVQLPT
jgi:tetratricopeptide (TPR) repeat protein